MKEKTQTITEEEYQKIEQELENILAMLQQWKASIGQQLYKAHFPLAGNFEELLINLIRSNHKIENKIDQTIKRFLASQNFSKQEKEKLNFTIRTQKQQQEEKKEITIPETKTDIIPLLATYPQLETVYMTIQEETNKKIANLRLIEEIKMIQKQFDTLQMKKHQYEKQQKRKVKQKK